MKRICLLLVIIVSSLAVSAQQVDSMQNALNNKSDTSIHVKQDTVVHVNPDTALRIIDLNPYFTLHVDSSLYYQLQINKNPANYFWYLKNAPLGLRINKDNGMITFKADKSLFLSGKLKYDVNYKVIVGVQNLSVPTDKVDTSFSIVFYNTDIIPSKVKPTVSSVVTVEEGDTVNFKVLCETGSFPIENIITLSSVPITNYRLVQQCGDEFSWSPPFDFVKDNDSGKMKSLNLYFIGSTKFQAKDTSIVRIIVKDALNYPLAKMEYNQVAKNVNKYVLLLKYTFLQLDKKMKKTKGARTGFDLTSTSTSLTGTILSTSSDPSTKRYGQILPSVGLALVPIKEAAVPTKVVDQNQASQIRSTIKRLEYMEQDNMLIGDRDPAITQKTNKLKDELKQAQVQLIDIPIEINSDMSEEELNRYFNSPKVNKKYRMSRK
jgi:hypothetical protein